MRISLGLALLLGVCHANHALAVTPVSEVGAYSFGVTVGGQTMRVPYDANQMLTSSPQVVRAILVIPGSNRSCDYGYDTMRQAASAAGMLNSSTLLLAPQFLLEDDIVAHNLGSDRLFWEEDGWKEGDVSLSTTAHPRPGTISSFAVLDSLLSQLTALYPNLKTIVIAGHSAGGQVVNRYAVGSPIPDSIRVPVTFVVANPGSYLYLNSERLVSGTSDTFAVPSSPDCSYDRYKYGLQSRSGYMARLTTSQLRAQFHKRRVVYLLGQADNDPAHPELDVSCSASYQGPTRLDRGRNYLKHLSDVYGSLSNANQTKIEVPGVGHDSRDVFTSVCGIATLFSVTGCATLVDVAEEPAPSSAPLAGDRLWNEPNPFRGSTTIHLARTSDRSAAELSIYDVRGRRVRTLSIGGAVASVVWNGASDSGEPLPPGVYFVRQGDGPTATRRVTLLR